MGAPRFRLQLFGTPDLTNGDGRSVHSVLAQPKRFALLAYIAAVEPSGPQTRETLLAMFWPESDAEHARNSLSQSLTYLRRSLGGDLFRASAEAVEINKDALVTDVVEFPMACGCGRLEDAVGLYRGDLLTGFHITDAPQFERWVDAERGRLARRAGGVALGGSLGRRRKGRPRRCSEVGPPCSRMGAAERIGTPPADGGARFVRQQRDCDRGLRCFSRSLSADLELSAAPETEALVNRIRDRRNPSDGAVVVPESFTEPETTSANDTPNLPTRVEASGKAGRPGRRLPARLLIAAGALAWPRSRPLASEGSGRSRSTTRAYSSPRSRTARETRTSTCSDTWCRIG